MHEPRNGFNLPAFLFGSLNGMHKRLVTTSRACYKNGFWEMLVIGRCNIHFLLSSQLVSQGQLVQLAEVWNHVLFCCGAEHLHNAMCVHRHMMRDCIQRGNTESDLEMVNGASARSPAQLYPSKIHGNKSVSINKVIPRSIKGQKKEKEKRGSRGSNVFHPRKGPLHSKEP